MGVVYSMFIIRFVAKLYLAEALIQLGRTPEALHHLNPESIVDLHVTHSPLCK